MKRLVPFQQGSLTAFVNPQQIQNWRHYHGKTAAGVQVNSIQAQEIGDSILLKQGNGVLSVTKNELEVMATMFLTEKGFTVTPPSGAAGH